MLPASPTPRSNSRSSVTFSQWQIALVALLVLYTLAVGIGLLANIVRPGRSFLLFAIPCLFPALWCALGFWRAADGKESDPGLLLSTMGWVLLGLSLLFKHIAVVGAGADAYASEATNPMVFVCAALGVLLLLVGAAFSWSFWTRHFDS